MSAVQADAAPSRQQLEVFDARPSARAVALVYEYEHGPGSLRKPLEAALPPGAHLIWSGTAEQTLIGTDALRPQAHLLRFASRAQARAFVTSAAHARLFAPVTNLRVAAVSDRSRLLPLVSSMLAWLMPRLPLDLRQEPGEEPGLGVKGHMPTHAAMQAFLSHPQQHTPVMMINWLKFREQAVDASGGPAVTGLQAYRRYGRVAVPTIHHLGGRLWFACRYQQVLVGNGGDPAIAAWDEFALMQYPARATFKFMASLARYRAAMVDRDAGLTDQGQGLTIARPDADLIR